MKSLLKIMAIAAATLALSACEESRPSNILSDEEMESVMYDLYMTEGALNSKGLNNSDSTATEYYNSVLKSHNLTKKQFDESVEWFSEHLETWQKVTENVAIEIEKERGH